VKNAALLLIVFSLLGAAFGPAYYSATELERALATGDKAKIEAWVDFDAVRAQMKAQVEEAAASKAGDNPLLGAIAKIASSAGGAVVEGLVTPEGLLLMMGGGGAEATPFGDALGGFEAWDRFALELRPKGEPLAEGGSASGERVAFVFTRSGLLFWRVTEIRLPLD